jgi:hypothetical protein
MQIRLHRRAKLIAMPHETAAEAVGQVAGESKGATTFE